MKKILLMSALILTAASVSAQYRESHDLLEKLQWNAERLNIMMDTRFDLEATLNDYDYLSGMEAVPDRDLNEAKFRTQTLRVLLLGEIAPGIRYRFRQRLNGDYGNLKEDGLLSATDHAWIAVDFGKQKNWTATIGKQSIQHGTFEYDYNGADIYLPTMCFNNLAFYATGVNIAYTFSNQRVNLQVTNSPYSTDKYKNKAFGGSILWEGNLYKDLIKTRWAYSAFQHDSRKLYNWLTIGTQLNIHKFSTELDYYLGESYYNEQSDLRNQSASIQLKWLLGKWHPSVKGVWNDQYAKGYSEKANDSWGIQAATEFYPFPNDAVKDLRFHLAYTYGSTEYFGRMAGNNADNNKHTIILGMRWLFKVK